MASSSVMGSFLAGGRPALWRLAGALLLACGPAAAKAAVPLPPQRPAALATAIPVPSRRPLPRAMPLPPPLPAELAEARAEEGEPAAPEREGEDMQAAPERTDAPVRLAARTAPEAPEAPETSAPTPIPLPPRRGEPEAAPAEPGAGAASASGTLPERCAALVAAGTIVAVAEPGIPLQGSCGLLQPVRFSAVRLRDGRLVELRPAAILKCEVAAAAADWLRDDLAPAIAALGAPLEVVKVAASYDCRPRNRVAGARMSEHGLGNALDVGGFELGDRRTVAVEKGGLPPPLRTAMKDSACRRFATVLGPGSDGYHEDHIHVDLAQRKGDYKICHWNLEAGTVIARKDDGAAAGPPPKPPAPDASSGGTAEASPAAAPGAKPSSAGPAPVPAKRPASKGGANVAGPKKDGAASGWK